MLETGPAGSRFASNGDCFGFGAPVGDGEGSSAELFEGGSGHPQGFPQGDNGEAFPSAGLTPLPGEGVGSSPADPENLGGFFDSEEVRGVDASLFISPCCIVNSGNGSRYASILQHVYRLLTFYVDLR